MSKSGVNRVVWNRPIFSSSSSSNFSQNSSSNSNSTASLSRKSNITSTNSTPYELNYLRNQKNVPTERVPFLAVARSLGDLWSYDTQHDEFIVSPVPDTFCFEIDPRYHKCLILATDGLWNVLKSSESVELVRQTDRETERLVSKRSNNNNTSQVQPFINPSQRLVQTAIQKCCEKMIRADNTSCITIMIDQPPEYNNTHLNSTHISRNRTFNDFSCNDFDDEDDDEFNSDFDDEEEDDSDDINVTYRRRNRSMRSVINDDNKSEMFNTPLNNDKRSRSLISVRRRHWSASSNRSSSASSTIASSSTNNTKKFVNVEPRTRSSRNYHDMNKSASANSIYSMDQLNSNKKIFQSINNNNNNNNNNAKNGNNVSIKQKTTNLNTSTLSKISKNLRKSLNDLYTSKQQTRPKLPQSSTSSNIKEEQKENEDNKNIVNKKIESPTSNKNRYTKRLKRLKNRLIQTKNNIFNRKQTAKKTSPSSNKETTSNLNKLKSISSPHINKSDFKYKLNISSIDLNSDDIDHYNDIDMSSSTTSNQTNRSFVNSVKSYLKRNRSRNKLGDQSCNFLNSTNINQLSQLQQQQQQQQQHPSQPLHASNKRPKFY